MKLVYVVADSISMQYGPYLEQAIAGTFAYDRKGGDEAYKDLNLGVGANGGDSSAVLDYLQQCFANESFRPDILLINCGLHDIKKLDDKIQIPIEDYQSNLEAIVALIAEHGSQMVWVRTTPVDDAVHNDPAQDAAKGGSSFARYAKDCDAYNDVADAVMNKAAVPMIDLYAFTAAIDGDIYCDHVHFHDSVREQHGKFVAEELIKRFGSN